MPRGPMNHVPELAIPGTDFRMPSNAPSYHGRKIELGLRLQEKVRRQCEESLWSFTRWAWPMLEPGREFIDNWHLHVICEHLEAVTRGEISRLLINVPFRTSKSTYTSVAWPAWSWLQRPSMQWLCGSYAEKLAIRDSLKMRRLVQSPWYQELWPERVVLTGDQNEKKRFQNTANGYRIAFGMNAGVMGDGGDCLLIDDPHDRQGAASDVQREEALDQYDQALVTRLNSPDTDPIVIIMQRLHEKDLAGHVLEDKGWTHLMLPMSYEPLRKCVTTWKGHKFEDPRTEAGELLWPKRFSKLTVARLERQLGEYATAGQLQQRPAPAGGGILDVTKYRLWPHNKALPIFDHIIQSYDTAFTDQTQNDPTACTVWGTFTHTEAGFTTRNAMVLEVWTDHMNYPALKKRMREDWKAVYGGDDSDPLNKPRRADALLVEDKGSGISVRQDLLISGLPVMKFNPGEASKTARAQLAAPQLDAGVLWLIESRKDKGQPVKWARPLVEQSRVFPNGEHDDLVDTKTQAVIYMQRNGLLETVELHEEPEPTEKDYHKPKGSRGPGGNNPYGA